MRTKKFVCWQRLGEFRDVEVFYTSRGMSRYVIVTDIVDGKTILTRQFKGNNAHNRAVKFAEEMAACEAFPPCNPAAEMYAMFDEMVEADRPRMDAIRRANDNARLDALEIRKVEHIKRESR